MTTGPDPMISALFGVMRTARGAGLAGTGYVAGEPAPVASAESEGVAGSGNG